MFTIYIASDGTGKTASQALEAALTQFSGIKYDVEIFSNLRTKDEVKEIAKQASKQKSFIVHTLVKNDIREEMIRSGRKFNVETIDLMGPFMARLENLFENAPSEKPGIFHHLSEDYFRRMDCMQFAFKHDDGKKTDELDKAEIVLLGVSRTFKTPLSIYLAFKRWFVANVPIVYGIQPPDSLLSLPANKVICLTAKVRHLSALRKVREEHLGGNTGNYASMKHVRDELFYAENFFKKNKEWPVISVTGKPIEEIASEIVILIGSSNKSD